MGIEIKGGKVLQCLSWTYKHKQVNIGSVNKVLQTADGQCRIVEGGVCIVGKFTVWFLSKKTQNGIS